MAGELARGGVSALSAGGDLSDLLALYLGGRSPTTIAGYRQALDAYARWTGRELEPACRVLLSMGGPEAYTYILRYRQDLHDAGRAPGTIAHRLQVLRGLCKLARTAGLISWTLDVPAPRRETVRDTRGPGRDGYRKLLAIAHRQDEPKASRDAAILHLLYDLALRRAEVVGLDLADVHLSDGVIAVKGKGRAGKSWLTLPGPTLRALKSWMLRRGHDAGPLFTSLDRARKGNGRLALASINHLISALGKRCGVKTRPHGLRHAAITEALDRTSGDLRRVAKFSRHRNLQMLAVYDDARGDVGGEVAALIAED